MPEVYRGRKSRGRKSGRKSPRKYSKDRKSGRKSPRKYSKGRKSGRKYSKGRKSPRYSRSRNRFRGVTYRSVDDIPDMSPDEIEDALKEVQPTPIRQTTQGATSSSPQAPSSISSSVINTLTTQDNQDIIDEANRQQQIRDDVLDEILAEGIEQDIESDPNLSEAQKLKIRRERSRIRHTKGINVGRKAEITPTEDGKRFKKAPDKFI